MVYKCTVCSGKKQLPPCPKCKGKVELDWVENVVGCGDIPDFVFGYEGTFQLAGAHVHAFEQFGSYQGEWWAKVTYKGQTGWISGSYGSCSGCDSFQSEFDCTGHEHENNNFVSTFDLPKYYDKNCEKCVELKDKLIKFGEDYLTYIYTQEEAEENAAKNLDWDDNAEEMVKFIKDNA